MVIILSVFIYKIPNEITDYEDVRGYPMKLTDEEKGNETIIEALRQVGSKKLLSTYLVLHTTLPDTTGAKYTVVVYLVLPVAGAK